MLKMIHPDVESVASVVNPQVFNAVWAPRGWRLLPEPEAVATDLLGVPVKKLDDLKVDELRALVAARGLEYPASVRKKDDVISLYRGSFAAVIAEPEPDEDPEGDEPGGGEGGSPDPAAAGATTNNKDK